MYEVSFERSYVSSGLKFLYKQPRPRTWIGLDYYVHTIHPLTT